MPEKFIFICMPGLIEDSDIDGEDDNLIEDFERRITNMKVVPGHGQAKSDVTFDDGKFNMVEFVELDTIQREVGDLAAALRIRAEENVDLDDPADDQSQSLCERLDKISDRLIASLKFA
jgi:hypothetical protein